MAERGKIPIPKSQKEISNSLINPYNELGGNPNDAVSDITNRGNQRSFKDDTVKPFTLGLKEIDEAVVYYLENIVKPTIQQNGVVQKVPVVYGSPERWSQIQKDGYYRDKKGKIMLPIISFKRNNIEKDRTLTNKLDANSPKNVEIFTKNYTSKDKYNNFNLLNNRVPQKQNYIVVVPDYVTITYDFVIATYYVEQLNKIIEAMNYASDSYWGNPASFKFRAVIDSFSTPVEVVQGNERTVRATFTVKLRGYTVPDTVQKELSTLKKFSNKTQVVFSLEDSEIISKGKIVTESVRRTSFTGGGGGGVSPTPPIDTSAFATTGSNSFIGSQTIAGGENISPALFTSIQSTINSGSQQIYAFDFNSYNSIFFDYSLTSGSNARAGSIVVSINDNQVKYYENTTEDNGDTSDVNFDVELSSSLFVLNADSLTDNWLFKSIVRAI